MAYVKCKKFYSHEMLIYKSRADRLKVFVELCQCATKEKRYLFVLDSKSLELINRISKSLGVLTKTERVELVSIEEFYPPSDELLSELIELLEVAYERTIENEYATMEVVLDMGFFATFLSSEEILALEKRVDSFFSRRNSQCLCLFFYENISPTIINSLKKYHSRTHLSESLLSDFFYSSGTPPHFSFPPNEILADMLLLNESTLNALQKNKDAVKGFQIGSLLSLVEQAIWIVDETYTLKYVSPSIEQLTGFPPERFHDKHITEFLPPNEYERTLSLLGKFSREASASQQKKVWTTFTTTVPTDEGRDFFLEHVIYPIVWHEEVKGFAGISRPRWSSYTAASDPAESFIHGWDKVWNSLPVGVVITDENDNILFLNSFFSELTGIKYSRSIPRYNELPCWQGHGKGSGEKDLPLSEHSTKSPRTEYRNMYSSALKIHEGKLIPVHISDANLHSHFESGSHLYFVVPDILHDPKEIAGWIKKKYSEEQKSTSGFELIQEKFNLTEREGHVLHYVMEGLKNKEIGSQLHIEEITVKKHLSHIFEKCGVKSRFELARYIASMRANIEQIS